MTLTALFLISAAYIGEHYVRDPTSNFLGLADYNYSGLYVNADQLGIEGERLLQEDKKSESSKNEESKPKILTRAERIKKQRNDPKHPYKDAGMEADKLHIYRMGYVEFAPGREAKCYDS